MNPPLPQQEGVDAPPEEERPLEAAAEADLGDFNPDLAGDADLSFATMFASSLAREDSSCAATPALPAGGGLSSFEAAAAALGTLPVSAVCLIQRWAHSPACVIPFHVSKTNASYTKSGGHQK